MVFGGCDPLTRTSDFELSKHAFQEDFNKKQCLRAWEEVGVAPVIQKCLKSDKVHREFGDKEDEMNEMQWI